MTGKPVDERLAERQEHGIALVAALDVNRRRVLTPIGTETR